MKRSFWGFILLLFLLVACNSTQYNPGKHKEVETPDISLSSTQKSANLDTPTTSTDISKESITPENIDRLEMINGIGNPSRFASYLSPNGAWLISLVDTGISFSRSSDPQQPDTYVEQKIAIFRTSDMVVEATATLPNGGKLSSTPRISTNGKFLALLVADQSGKNLQIMMYQTSTGKLLWQKNAMDYTVDSTLDPAFAFSPDEITLAIGDGRHGQVLLVDSVNGDEIRALPVTTRSAEINQSPSGFNQEILEFSPDGRWLFLMAVDSFFRWDLTSDNFDPLRVSYPTGLSYINCGAITPDSKTLVVIGPDNLSIHLFEIESIAETHSFTADGLTTPGYIDKTYRNSCLISSDGRYLAAPETQDIFNSNAVYSIWDLTSGKRIQNVADASPFLQISFTKDDQYMILNGVTRFDLVTQKIEDLYPPLWENFKIAVDVPLAVTGNEPQISLWNVETLEKLGDYQSMEKIGSDFWKHFEKKKCKYPASLPEPVDWKPESFTLDCQLMAIYEGGLELWDIPKDRMLFSVPIENTISIAFSPDGRLLAVEDGQTLLQIHIYQTDTMEEIRTIQIYPFLQGRANDAQLYFTNSGRSLVIEHNNWLTTWGIRE